MYPCKCFIFIFPRSSKNKRKLGPKTSFSDTDAIAWKILTRQTRNDPQFWKKKYKNRLWARHLPIFFLVHNMTNYSFHWNLISSPGQIVHGWTAPKYVVSYVIIFYYLLCSQYINEIKKTIYKICPLLNIVLSQTVIKIAKFLFTLLIRQVACNVCSTFN